MGPDFPPIVYSKEHCEGRDKMEYFVKRKVNMEEVQRETNKIF